MRHIAICCFFQLENRRNWKLRGAFEGRILNLLCLFDTLASVDVIVDNSPPFWLREAKYRLASIALSNQNMGCSTNSMPSWWKYGNVQLKMIKHRCLSTKPTNFFANLCLFIEWNYWPEKRRHVKRNFLKVKWKSEIFPILN